MEYRLATHLGSGEMVFSVDPERLTVLSEKTGKTVTADFSELTEINLHPGPDACMAVVKRRSGPPIVIPSRHFLGFARFEPRSAEYVRFLEALHRGCQAANPNVRYVAGSSLLYVLGVICVALGVLLGIGLVAGALWKRSLPPVQAIAPLPVALLAGARFVKQGRALNYDPLALPTKYLPVGP